MTHSVCVCVCPQVDVIKEAYLQGVESEVDGEVSGDEISPKDVGHNIYILAHQVGFYFQFRFGNDLITCTSIFYVTIVLMDRYQSVMYF